jgi:hypothetical protein
MSRDERRVPLVVTAETRFASIRGELVDYSAARPTATPP